MDVNTIVILFPFHDKIIIEREGRGGLKMQLQEIMFIGEEDPEKGYTAQALGYSTFKKEIV